MLHTGAEAELQLHPVPELQPNPDPKLQPNPEPELQPNPEPESQPNPEPELQPNHEPELQLEPLVADPLKATDADQIASELNPDILVALGAKTGDDAVYGNKIHENLAQLWTPLLKKGMSKDDKDKLLKEYLVPQNCSLLQSPKLNPEISAAVPETARGRDKKISFNQQQLGAGITAINRAMDVLINGNEDNLKAIRFLSDACRILSDLHHVNTQARIKLLTPGLEKQFLNVIQDASRDETLFGNNLSEKIKACKAIEKQGLQIKKNPTNLIPAPSYPPYPSTSTARPPQHRGNWSWPPRYPLIKMTRGAPRRTSSYRPSSASSAQTRPASKATTRAQLARR
ncbi:uncharacterized protein LOC134806258 [Cydia splendana]|uniref:uncharacterized protein LOC134806258 n=1 Tax=Cydia splendana TaxID=1100963 RepID=UPI00300CE91F